MPLARNEMMKLGSCLAVMFLLAVFVDCRQSETIQQAEVEIVPATAQGCRRNTINVANHRALLESTKDKAFVIAHLGTGETNPRLNHRRLNDVKTEFGLGNSPKLIFAEGGRVQGAGRIEFYLGSELMSVSLLARNGDFCAACCDRKKLFYRERSVWRYPRRRLNPANANPRTTAK